MSLEGKSIVSIDDLSDSEIERILEVAGEFDEALQQETALPLLRGKKLFTLFYEPSSRTYFSFREAMRRLGGDWDGVLDASSSTSVAKGESIADTIRTFQVMADVIVMRHPYDGSVRVAEDYASKPVINAGDGAHEHPTQTLVDLYTILKEKGAIRGQTVALCGDLLHARTVHSLAYALARFGAKLRTISLPGLGLPTYVRARLQRMRCDLQEYTSMSEAFREDSVVIYRAEPGVNGARRRAKQSARFQLLGEFFQELTALYMTRLQTERFEEDEQSPQPQVEVLTAELLRSAPESTIVLHPLPRRNEIAYEVDTDKRASYFRQMQNSIPVRMAILALVLGAKESKGTKPKRERPHYVHVPEDTRCANSRCVVNHESYVSPRYAGDPSNPRLVRCAYCDQEVLLGADWEPSLPAPAAAELTEKGGS